MRLSFQLKRFFKAILGLSALTLTQCNKPAADAPASATTPAPKGAAPNAGTPSANSIAVIGEGASPAFRAVASRLELGGCFFDYSEAAGAPALAAFLDEIMKVMPVSERKDIPADFTFAKVFRLLGLDSVAATGSSSRARADGAFHSRTFAYMPQGRKGLMSLSGGPAAKLLLDLAPKDTDLALEFPISLKDFAREGLPGILAMIPPAERAQFDRQMSQPLPPLGLSGRQMIEKLDARAGIFLRLDPAQKFQPVPDMPPMPGVDGVIVIERLGWLVEALKPQFMPMLSQPGAPVTVTDEGGVLTVRFKGPAGLPPMDYQPAVQFDSKADRILIASRPALFDSVIGGKEKIAQGADFAQAWRDLPGEGNACIYASPRLLQTIGDLIAKAAQNEGGSAADKAMIAKIFDWVKPFLSRGQAVVMANQPDGILMLSNTSIPAGSSTMTAVSTIATLAGFALPVFTAAQEKGRQIDDMNKLRQVQVGLRLYASDNAGKYPAALTDLVPKYNFNAVIEFTDHRTKQRMPWLYRNSLTTNAPNDETLVASPVATPDGKRVVGFNDGSVRIVPEAEFQKLWGRK